MKRIGGRLKAAGALALALMLAPVSLAAQSGETYRLPGATVQPAGPGAQGPVDRDNPIVTKSVPRPTPSATPTQEPVPTPSATQPSPTTSAAPSPTASRTPVPRPATATPHQVGPAASTASAPTPGLIPPTFEATPAAFPTATLPSEVSTPPAAPTAVDAASAPGWYWPWIAGATGLLALIFAGLWWNRRREPKALKLEFERPVVSPPMPEPASEPQPLAATPQPEPTPIPEPRLSAALPANLGILLEARRMSASLVATTLSYSLTLTNTGTEALSALAVEGDMVSAHSSLPPEAQIASDSQRLELRHALVGLAPGESAEFTGDFRLPLTAVTPIRAGNAAYFVPLARLRIEASTSSGGSLVQVQTFVVGELPEAEGAALKPFRLDLGPRTYSQVGQRPVN
jgi:hypothetical protein